MPTYDYECDACGHAFELFQTISEPVKRKCPECKKQKLRRLFGTGAAVMFKGSGFYQTDYRSDSYKKAAAAEKKSTSETSESSSKSEGKSSDSNSKSSSDSSSKSEAPKKGESPKSDS
ncbi:MAG TPA: zinc ribbon domain-containing protein [Pirellulaceae bacterium]|nr:zinc ribbon domain-containing protein [Pirellulaceae bacterium]